MAGRKPKETPRGRTTATSTSNIPPARTMLGELSQNVQLPIPGSPIKPIQDTQARRPQRKAARDAQTAISDQYNLQLDSLSPNRKPRGGYAARDVSSSEADYLSDGSISECCLESEDEASLDQDEASLDQDELLIEGFNQEYIPCAENNDSECEEEEVSDQPDSESSSDQDSGREWTGWKSKRAFPARKVAGSRRRNKHRKRPTKSAAQWVKEQNQNSEFGPDDPDVQRFQKNLGEIIRRLHDRIHTGSWTERQKLRSSVHGSTFKLYSEKTPEEICEDLFKGIPFPTQHILGKTDLKPEDLLNLPDDAAKLFRGGVYLNILARFAMEKIEHKPHPDLKFNKIDTVRTTQASPDEAKEFRLYGGSSVLNVPNRTRTHLLEMHRPDDDKKAPETVHYIKFGNFHDVVSNFRLVAAWDPDEDRRLPVLFEGLLMTYLGLQTDGEDSPHHPLSTYQLNRELREGLDLPDFMGISLNRAWPLFAGIGFYADGNDHYKCANPKCNSKWNYGRWCDPPEGIGINGRICRRCSVFSRQYPGCVWPVKPDGLACAGYGVDGKLAHCENPGHPSDRDAKERVYRLNRQEIPRCRFCVGWVRYHKHDYPINVNGEDVTQPKPANVCANPGHKDTWNEYKTVYVAEDDGILRCAMCRKWRVANDGNDYPIDKNGLDHSTLSYDRCLNPNHPSNTPHNKVSFSDVMRQVRCWRCLRWASTWGQDFPAKKPKVPKAPTVPTAPKKK